MATLIVAGNSFSAEAADGWPHYGGSLGGDRYAAPSGITPERVGRLTRGWVYRTGDTTDGGGFGGNPSRFRATPILVRGKLIASTGFNRVFALDAATGNRTGGANVWSVMSADPRRDLVFLPTTSPSPDFFGGKRLGDNAFANSVVALRASTGEFVWGYQTVRHDLWDYDLAAQPLLFQHTSADATRRPAVAQATKTGFVFVLDRVSGEPLHPVEERAVPESDVPGEEAAPTQPFPKLRLHVTDARPLRFWDVTEAHAAACRRLMAGVRYEGIFTPPSLAGTMLYPGNAGGTNWGSMAYDRGSRIGYLAVNRWPTIVKLIPRGQFNAARRRGTLNGKAAQHTAQNGTPYGMARTELDHNHLPCLEGPWATLVALDLDVGEVLWEQPVGYIRSGGPMVTEGGVVFLATSSTLRAYDGAGGNELWTGALPADVHSTPMGHRHDGVDYVVVTAGGNLAAGEGRGGFVIAFRLAPDAP